MKFDMSLLGLDSMAELMTPLNFRAKRRRCST